MGNTGKENVAELTSVPSYQSQHIGNVESLELSTSIIDNERPKKHFSILSAIGVQYSITAAPLTLGYYLSLTLGIGGGPGMLYGFLFVAVFQAIGVLAVSELASAYPHSSGIVVATAS